MLSKIQHQLASLSTAECKVARLILEQPSDAARSAVGDIARLAQVSQPTVIRFCRTLGYRGWPDFKIKLAASLMVGIPYVHSSLRTGEPTAELATKIFDKDRKSTRLNSSH